MEFLFGLIGANLPQGFLGLLAIIAGLIVIAVVFVFVVDLLLSIIAPNTRGIFFRRHVKDDKYVEPTVVTKTTTTTTSTITSYEDEFEDAEAKTTTTTSTTTNVWDDELVEKEQEDLLAGGNGVQDEFDDFEKKSFSSDREEAINRRRQEFEDFDNLYKVDENNDAEDINRLIDEVNEYAIAQYYNQGDESGAFELVEPAEIVEEEIIQEPEAETQVTEEFITEEELLADEEIVEETITEEVVETQVIEDTTESQETISAESTIEDTIVEPVVETETEETPVQEVAEVAETQPEVEEVIAPVAETVVVTKTIISDVSLEQLENRLKVLQARLKANEKDLKTNRKEYLPLARVQKTLQKDQEKLRRREAIVARKKVILYGVNNYVDIDEEKAKKLSEDLDLLDGLRLSVQHCEDVMNANKDRFPILERTNKILVDLNKDLKSDIEEIKKAIEQYKADINLD